MTKKLFFSIILLTGAITISWNGTVHACTGGNYSVSLSTIDFDSVVVGNSSTGQEITMTNDGGCDSMTGFATTITGTNSGEFSVTNSCTTIAVNQTCTVTVQFNPTSTGVMNATLQIDVNEVGPKYVDLTGTGTDTVSDGDSSVTDNSGDDTGCGSAGNAAVNNGKSNSIVPPFLSLIVTLIFPLGIILFFRRKLRHRRL